MATASVLGAIGIYEVVEEYGVYIAIGVTVAVVLSLVLRASGPKWICQRCGKKFS